MLVKNDIEQILKLAFNSAGYESSDVDVKFSALGDAHFQCNSCFKVAKMKGQNPSIVAQDIIKSIKLCLVGNLGAHSCLR